MRHIDEIGVLRANLLMQKMVPRQHVAAERARAGRMRRVAVDQLDRAAAILVDGIQARVVMRVALADGVVADLVDEAVVVHPAKFGDVGIVVGGHHGRLVGLQVEDDEEIALVLAAGHRREVASVRRQQRAAKTRVREKGFDRRADRRRRSLRVGATADGGQQNKRAT